MDGLIGAPGRIGGDVLPRPAPLAMPVQSLRQSPGAAPRPATSPPRMRVRRAVLWSCVTLTSSLGLWRVSGELGADSFGPLDLPILAVFAVLFAWSALAFFNACAGLYAIVRRRHPLGLDPAAPRPTLASRTAILAPVYNEAPHEVFGRLQAMCEELIDAGEAHRFDLFVLSDSTERAISAEETHAFALLRRRLAGRLASYYRQRTANTDRKAGNIADWVRRFGGAYDFFVVLDADSLMTADALVRLAGAMERAPDVGLIQTLPLVIGRVGLLSRAQQFASRLYGPLIAHGVAWWSGAEANYWGHNAIVRVEAFAGRAGLPRLTGRAPIGGSILSHDFVEAALIRRGGYAVHIAPQLGGSYEGCPPSLAELIKRDRRWCQGNLQHLGVLATKGLHWMSRLQLLSGICAYATAPLWLALLLLNLVLDAYPALGRSGPTPGSPAPSHTLPWTFLAAMLFFLAPRALAWMLAVSDAPQRRGFGGRGQALASVAAEALISALVTPVLLVSQACALCAALVGRDCGWRPQARGDRSLGLAEALRGHWRHTLAGLVVGVLALFLARGSMLWLAPVVPSLILSAPLADLLTRPDLGEAMRRIGLLRTPEESAPPPLITRAAELAADYAAAALRPTVLIAAPARVEALPIALTATLRLAS